MKDEKNKKEKDGNVILLVVIAIFTMIVVVVGATFAYLASSIDAEETQNVKATTNGTSDLLFFNVPSELNLTVTEGIDLCPADDETCLNTNDAIESVASSITYQTSSATGGSANYKVALNVDEGNNDFEYTSGTCSLGNDYTNILECNADDGEWTPISNPELLFFLYEEADSETTCDDTSVGICFEKTVDGTIEVKDDYTDYGSCSAQGYYWNESAYLLAKGSDVLKNDATLYDKVADKCFNLVNVSDVTTLGNEETEELSLQNSNVTSEDNTVIHKYYVAAISMVNYLDHNQIQNGQKSFTGSLRFSYDTTE